MRRFLAIAVLLAACGRGGETDTDADSGRTSAGPGVPEREERASNGIRKTPGVLEPDDERSASGPVHIVMKDVEAPLGSERLMARNLRGTLRGLHGTPDIVDPTSYAIVVDEAEVFLDDAGLDEVMKRSEDKDAALADVHVTCRDGRMTVEGTSTRPAPAKVKMVSAVRVEGGKLVLRPETVKVMGVKANGAMEALDLTLEDVIGHDAGRGLTVNGNVIVVDALEDLPPPAIDAAVTGARVEDGGLAITLGPADEKHAHERVPDVPIDEATDQPGGNHVIYYGGTLNVGKLTQHGSDLQVYDKDPKDALFASSTQFEAQLADGDVKVRVGGGLRVWVRDWDDLQATKGDQGRQGGP